MPDRPKRWRRVAVFLIWAIGMVWLVAWTVRAVGPDRPLKGAPRTVHYLPVAGDQLFRLERPDGDIGAYTVQSSVACRDAHGLPAVQLRHDQVMSCDSGRAALRLRLDSAGAQHELVVDGFSLSIPAAANGVLMTAGQGRDADIVLSLPGVGAEHLELLAPSSCAATGAEPHLACVRNLGLRGSLIVDSTARLWVENGPIGDTAPLLRRAPDRDIALPLHDGDIVWLGQVPLVVDRDRIEGGATIVDFRIPREGLDAKDWRTVAGDRRWMAMDLPSWPLGRAVETDTGWEAEGPGRFTFLSREQLFQSAFLPLPWNLHLDDRRIEWQQEEQLQRLIDHELLCLQSSFDPSSPPARHEAFPISLVWNLESGRGCDGSAIPPQPLELFRLATESAHDRDTNQRLETAAKLMRGLPEKLVSPAELGFVFDWARYEGSDEALAVVPVRLLGVRPLSTNNGPSWEHDGTQIDEDDECALAESGLALPPISVRSGSTSSTLRVQTSTRIAPGARLLMLSDTMSVCVGPTIPDANTHPQLASQRVGAEQRTVLLGHLGVSVQDAQWSARGMLANEATTCALMGRSDAGWRLTREGSGELTVHRQAGPELLDLGPGDDTILQPGDHLTLTAGGVELELVFEDSDHRDWVAFTEVDDNTLLRRYPFGEDLGAFLGVQGRVWGGIESWLEPELVREAQEAWEDSCGDPSALATVELTLLGDIQRILFSEIAALQSRVQETSGAIQNEHGDYEAHEVVRVQAVLMDASTGDLLAVANAPSFDPEDEAELRRIQDALKRRDGRWQSPAQLENLAFRRNLNIGSVYKLATSYAMARGGLFEQSGSPDPASCWRMGFRQVASNGGDVDITPELGASKTPSRIRCASRVDGTRLIGLGAPAAGLPSAFKWSHNTYFSLATLALAPASGIRFQMVPSSLPDPDRASLLLVSEAGGQVAEFLFTPGFDVSADLGRGNEFFDTLVLLGHRYHYGARVSTQWVEEVNGTRFPSTGDARWLPGLQVGGFWYPSVTGPELYSIERELLDVEVRTKRGPDENTYLRNLRASHITDYAKIGYGMGGIQSNALALAVLATPMVAEGDVIAPDLIVGASSTERRVMTADLIEETHRASLEQHMKAVVRSGTAEDYFPQAETELPGLGGKTGTFDTDARVGVDRARLGATHAALDRITSYACGEVGSELDLADWRLIESKAYLHESRPYVPAVVRKVLDGQLVPRAGFGASAMRCEDTNPGRAGVSQNLGTEEAPIDGGTWLDALYDAFSDPPVRTTLVPGSSLVTVLFEGLVPGTDLGKGWVLAVVSDGRDNKRGRPQATAKVASRRIWDRLRQYFELKLAASSGAP